MKKLSAAIVAKHARLGDAVASAADPLKGFLETLESVEDDLSDALERAQAYRDGRSDKWSESDKGEAYESWVGGMEARLNELTTLKEAVESCVEAMDDFDSSSLEAAPDEVD